MALSFSANEKNPYLKLIFIATRQVNFTPSHEQHTSFAVEVGYCVFERGGVLEKLRSIALLSLHDVRPCSCAILYCHTIALISSLLPIQRFAKSICPFCTRLKLALAAHQITIILEVYNLLSKLNREKINLIKISFRP